MSLQTNKLARQLEEIKVIRRLGNLGARSQAISMKLGGPDWTQTSVNKILRDFLGKGGAQGRRSTGSPSEMTRKQSDHVTLIHLLHELSRMHSDLPAQWTADSYEIYHFIATSLTDTKVNVEAAMTLSESVKLNVFKVARCKRCSTPRLINFDAISMFFSCQECDSIVRKSGEAAAG